MSDVWAALGDPTRRMILERVASGGGLTATQLASGLPITRQAVAKHLAVLQEAGLVEGSRAGRELRYVPTPAPLGEAIGWMTAVGARWDDRLAALERAARRRVRAAPTRPAAP